MEIRVWRSFSSNNSTSFRLLGRFRDPAAAEEAAAELGGFLAEVAPIAEHLRRPRKLTDATSFPFTEAMDALATEHGFDWTGLIADAVYDDALDIITDRETLILYHPYCLGLGEELPKYLRARGAEVDRERAGDPNISVLFRLPDDPEVRAQIELDLRTYFGQAEDGKDTMTWTKLAPWTERRTSYARSAEIAFFCDGKSVGFHLMTEPSQIALLREWLERAGVKDYRLRIGELADLSKFRTIARARCEGCNLPLEYIDMLDHAIASDQLACTRCGAMFDLAALAADNDKVGDER